MLESQNHSNIVRPRVWNKAIPTKVLGLTWRMLQNKIPSKDNLARRRVINQDLSRCVRKCGSEESVSHLFFRVSSICLEWSQLCRSTGGSIYSNLKVCWAERDWYLLSLQSYSLLACRSFGRLGTKTFSKTVKSSSRKWLKRWKFFFRNGSVSNQAGQKRKLLNGSCI